MDFVEGLPQSGSANCILVVVDKLTKYAHFVPLKHPYTAQSVARVLLDQIYKLHEMRKSIVSDRYKIFTGLFWKELFSLAKGQLRMSIAYHPQSNGQMECVNQCMEMFLHCFVSACPKRWLEWLSLSKYWYNNCYHFLISRSPFQALYGYVPRSFDLSTVNTATGGTLDTWLQ
jgi:hypothetical protein